MRIDVRHFEVRLFKVIAVFSTWIFANRVCGPANQNISNFLSGAVAMSVFAVSVQIHLVLYSLSTTMSNVFMLINRIVAGSDDNAEFARLIVRVDRYRAILFLWVLGAGAGLHRLLRPRCRSLHELALPAAHRARHGLLLVPCSAHRRRGALATAACLAGTVVLPVEGWFEFAACGVAYSALRAALFAAIDLDGAERATVANGARRFLGR